MGAFYCSAPANSAPVSSFNKSGLKEAEKSLEKTEMTKP